MDFKPVIDHLQNRLPKLLGCMPSAAGWSAVGKTHAGLPITVNIITQHLSDFSCCAKALLKAG
jgi:hypothetical protein